MVPGDLLSLRPRASRPFGRGPPRGSHVRQRKRFGLSKAVCYKELEEFTAAGRESLLQVEWLRVSKEVKSHLAGLVEGRPDKLEQLQCW
jgi:hypothetical protein